LIFFSEIPTIKTETGDTQHATHIQTHIILNIMANLRKYILLL